jgi:hypothetical protein
MKLKRFSFRLVTAVLAVMVMLGISGCNIGSNDPPELPNDSVKGIMNLNTAEKVFGKDGFVEYDKDVEILKFNNVEALGEYLRGAGRQVSAAAPATFKINSINGKPVTSIKPGAFKPDPALGGRDDISQLARVMNQGTAAADLPPVVIVLPDTLDLDIDALAQDGGLFEGVGGAIKVEIPTPVIEKILEKEIDKKVAAEGLTGAEAEARKQVIKEALTDSQGETAKELTEKLTETIQTAVGKGTGEGAAITVTQVAPTSPAPVTPGSPVVVIPDLPTEITVPPAPVDPPIETPPVVTPPTETPPAVNPPYTPPAPPYTPPDLTVPVLSANSTVAASFRGDTAEIRFTSDKAGTYYYVVVVGSETKEFTAAEIRAANAGMYGDGSAGTGTTAIPVTGLSLDIAYKAYLIVVDTSGNTSEILKIDSFTVVYTPAGKLGADLGGTGSVTGSGTTVRLEASKTIDTGAITVPEGVTLVTGLNILTVGTSAAFTVNGTLSVDGAFNMAGNLSVGEDGVIDVKSGGEIVFAADRTGGGDFKGTINVRDGGVSKDLKGNGDGSLWGAETGKTVFYAGAKGYSAGDAAANLMIGTEQVSTTTYIALKSGTFVRSKSGYVLDGGAYLNRTFCLEDQTLTIKPNGKLTVRIQTKDDLAADGLWVIGSSSKIVGGENAIIEVIAPSGSANLGLIFADGGVRNFFDSNGDKIETATPFIAIGTIGTYDWNDSLQGWKARD